MALPLVQMLGLASGALSLLNKALDKPTPQGFETVLAGQTGNVEGSAGSSLIKGLLAKLKAKDGESSDILAASGAGAMALQMMAILKDAGLSANDIQALLTGNGVNFSDDMLKKLLTSFGVSDTQIQTILADGGFKEELKSQIMEGLQTAMGTKVASNSAAALTGGQTGDAAQASQNATLKNASETQDTSEQSQTLAGVPQQIAEAVKDLVLSATKDDETLDAVLKQAASTSLTTSTQPEIKTALMSMVQGALKKAENKSHALKDVTTVSFDESSGTDSQTEAEVLEAVNTLTDTIGIKKDILEKLFFATDTAQRQAAADDVANQVAAFLKQQEGKPLAKEVKEALALVRSATTKEEWSSIESGIKLWRPDLQIPEAKLAFDKGSFNAVAAKLTGSEASPVYDRYAEQAIDQIKIQLSSQQGNNDGTATMRLNPPLLGRVEVNIAMEDGQLQATIRTDNQFTRDMLQTNITVLKEALAEQGIRVAQISVSAGLDYRQSQHQDAYAQLQQGRSSGDGHGRGSQHPGQQGNGENALSYTEAQKRGRFLASGSLDIFA